MRTHTCDTSNYVVYNYVMSYILFYLELYTEESSTVSLQSCARTATLVVGQECNMYNSTKVVFIFKKYRYNSSILLCIMSTAYIRCFAHKRAGTVGVYRPLVHST